MVSLLKSFPKSSVDDWMVPVYGNHACSKQRHREGKDLVEQLTAWTVARRFHPEAQINLHILPTQSDYCYHLLSILSLYILYVDIHAVFAILLCSYLCNFGIPLFCTTDNQTTREARCRCPASSESHLKFSNLLPARLPRQGKAN